jgi:hypothetical protein
LASSGPITTRNAHQRNYYGAAVARLTGAAAAPSDLPPGPSTSS